MTRHWALVGAALLVSLLASDGAVQAAVQAGAPWEGQPVRRMARAGMGSIEGVVQDEGGKPLVGAMVSALGTTTVLTVTDTRGRFALRELPVGAYLVRAHLPGFIASRRQFIEVRPSGRSSLSVALRRAADRVQPASFGGEEASERILAASVALPLGSTAALAPGRKGDTAPTEAGDDDHSETAWRLRHLKRSVLKDATQGVQTADGGQPVGEGYEDGMLTALGRALGSPVRFASAVFNDLPFSGEINLLTTGSFDDPSRFLSSDVLSRGVAFLSISGPAGRRADWSVHGMMTQGDVGSWFLAGAYRTRQKAGHAYDFGVSYSVQRFATGAAGRGQPVSDGSRWAGDVYGLDRWQISRRVSLAYGARYSRYDYLSGPGLFSPRLTVTLVPLDRLRVQTMVSRRMLAPGAEEFMPPLAAGLWVPPERTFAPVPGDAGLRPERTDHFEVAVEREFGNRYVVGFRTFYQQVDDQMAALFGVGVGDQPANIGRYYVGSAGDLSARGWSVGLSNAMAQHVRGSVAYEMTTTNWVDAGDAALMGIWAPAMLRRQTERLQDVTTSVETEIPQTSTRVFVVYKINTVFARPEPEAIKTGFDGRFDVQVTQPLRFLDFTSAQWQVLVAVRNLFRDLAADSSVYDELLVVRPPKRIVGGFLVKF